LRDTFGAKNFEIGYVTLTTPLFGVVCYPWARTCLSQPTCPCSSVVNALWCHVQWSVTHVQSSSRVRLPSTKELFQIIPTRMMNREIIPGRKKRV